MTPRLAELFDRAFPGMGHRPALMTVLAAASLLSYSTLSKKKWMPDGVLKAMASVSGIDAPSFHIHAYAHGMAVLCLLVVPLVVCRFAWKMGPRDLGFRLRGTRREWLVVLGLWAAFLPFVWLASHGESFQATYPKVPAVAASALLYVLYEVIYLTKWTAWEFFFRGFMLFGFEKDFGVKSVLISTIPFAVMHMHKPVPEMVGSILAGFLLCWIARQNRSVWPGVLLHSGVAASMDLFASNFWR